MSVVVFGGYGSFGVQVVRELARCGVAVAVAGRDLARARALVAQLGPPHSARAADVTRPESCLAALARHSVAVCCAGPFSSVGESLLEACLAAGRHYVDIADDRAYVAQVRSRDAAFRQRGLVAAYGCSSLPALSGALAQLARAQEPDPPRAVRVTLFIGNDNPKGRAAIRSAVASLGKPLQAPKATLLGFRDGEWVSLPAPFGRRRVYTLDSPDYDLLPALLGAAEVKVKVGFEMALTTRTFALLAALGSGYGARTAALLDWLGRLGPRVGCSGGAVFAELSWSDGRRHGASLSGAKDGQRMAGLPAALVAQALDAGAPAVRGALAAYELLGARPLLDAVAARGYQLAVA